MTISGQSSVNQSLGSQIELAAPLRPRFAAYNLIKPETWGGIAAHFASDHLSVSLGSVNTGDFISLSSFARCSFVAISLHYAHH